MKKICEVTPFLFNDHLVISFSKDWLQFFEKFPKFTAKIDNQSRLILVGPQISFENVLEKGGRSDKV